MAQAGYTPIQLYYSATVSNAPLAGNLLAGELAINTNDEKVYFKNSSGVVKVIASSAGAAATVSTVSVVSANGFGGTVANPTTTPAITLTTSVTGLLKGNGTGVSAAASGTDYAPPTSGTSILYGNGSGGFSNVTVGSGLSFVGGTLTSTGTGGTVTSVNVSGGTTGLTTSGGPIVGAGTITLAGTLAAANGGTGLTSPGTAGNVLTSNGTGWVSQTPSAGGSSQGFITQATGVDVAPGG